MPSNFPNDPNDPHHPKNSPPEPFRDLMKSMNDFFQERPIKGFLQSIDEFFKTPFPFAADFYVKTVETDDEYHISAELPGVKKEQIHIHTSGNYLTISVENKEIETTEDTKNHFYQRKSVRQQSSRTIPLPHPINEKQIKASYRDGLLQIKVPREKGAIIQIEDE